MSFADTSAARLVEDAEVDDAVVKYCNHVYLQAFQANKGEELYAAHRATKHQSSGPPGLGASLGRHAV